MKKKHICFTVLLSLFVILSAFTSSAQVRAISGITITATHEIEPGTWVTDDDIDKSGSGCIHVSIDNANCYIDSCTYSSSNVRITGGAPAHDLVAQYPEPL